MLDPTPVQDYRDYCCCTGLTRPPRPPVATALGIRCPVCGVAIGEAEKPERRCAGCGQPIACPSCGDASYPCCTHCN